MKKRFYPNVVVCCMICFFVSPTLATNPLKEPLVQTAPVSFVSSPVNNSINNPAPDLQVTANPVAGAKRYTIVLSATADFTGAWLIKASTKDYERTFLFTGLKYATVYYAKVKTDLSPAYGQVTKFTTRAEVFPVVVEPANGAIDTNPLALKVVIKPIQDAKRYTVELNTKSDFTGGSTLLATTMPGQTEFVFKNLKNAVAYFVRVRSDISTRFGPAIKFTTKQSAVNKRFWGVTTTSGAYGSGTIFSFSADSSTAVTQKFRKHHDYKESGDYQNSYLQGSLIPAPDGGYFGHSECANLGTCGNGEIYYVSPYGEFKLLSKPGLHDGGLMLASNNHLYAVDDWINYFQGGIIRVPSTATEFDLSHVIYRINSSAEGQNPNQPLIELANGYLYGVAPYGGTGNYGVIFRIRPDGSAFQVIHHFNGINGSYPRAGLLAGSDGYLYGTTSAGGQFHKGTIFKILPEGGSFTKIFDFNYGTGYNAGSLTESNRKLYGMTTSGGTYNHGVLFNIDITGTGFRKLFDFNGATGSSPAGAPTIHGGYVFGMTQKGGTNNLGVIYKIRTDGTSYEKLFDFTTASGGNPDGNLLLVDDVFEPSSTLTNSTVESSSENTQLRSYEVGIFPNPFISDFTAEITSTTDQAIQIMITDLHGQVMSKFNASTNSSLPLGDNLQKGIYILKVMNGKETSLHRIVKK